MAIVHVVHWLIQDDIILTFTSPYPWNKPNPTAGIKVPSFNLKFSHFIGADMLAICCNYQYNPR